MLKGENIYPRREQTSTQGCKEQQLWFPFSIFLGFSFAAYVLVSSLVCGYL